jgi:hypothetical protein
MFTFQKSKHLVAGCLPASAKNIHTSAKRIVSTGKTISHPGKVNRSLAENLSICAKNFLAPVSNFAQIDKFKRASSPTFVTYTHTICAAASKNRFFNVNEQNMPKTIVNYSRTSDAALNVQGL